MVLKTEKRGSTMKAKRCTATVSAMTKALSIGIAFVLVACVPLSTPSASLPLVQSTHIPERALQVQTLLGKALAYCWQTNERDAFGIGRTELVVVGEGRWDPRPITYPVEPPSTPRSIGCLGTGDSLRVGGHGFSWRSFQNQIAAVVGGSNPPGDNLYLIDVDAELNVSPKSSKIWQHQSSFLHPSAPTASPSGDWLGMTGEDADMPLWRNIWLYNPENQQAIRVFDTHNTYQFGSALAWAPDGSKLAGIVASEMAGIGIFDVQTLKSTIVTSLGNGAIGSWPYTLASPFNSNQDAIDFGRTEWTQYAILDSSPPIWLRDQRIIFVGPTPDRRVSLYAMNVDGSNLSELIPNLPGLVGNTSLSPDGTMIAFSRYPDWDELDREELVVLDLADMQLRSLLVLPAPVNGDLLITSGVSWSPDSRFLAFSSNTLGESDVYVVASDGTSWGNLTENSTGDAVFPQWKP